MLISRVELEPAPVYLVLLDSDEAKRHHPLTFGDLLQLDRDLVLCEFRGVKYERWSYVLAVGIDVEPTDEVIYADGIDKATEYPQAFQFPKLILALARSELKRAVQPAYPDTDPEVRQQLEATYPTKVQVPGQDVVLFTRLTEPVGEATLGYAESYGWWIPGDPLRALTALFVLYRDEDIEQVEQTCGISARLTP